MKKIRFILIVVLIAYFLGSFTREGYSREPASIYVVGQDTESISDFLLALNDFSERNAAVNPDGFMAYTAINDIRGLSEPVDHGAGMNCVDDLFQKYPRFPIVQIGLYMKYMLKEVLTGGLDQNIDKIGEWIKNSGKEVYLRIGYEFDSPDNEYDPQLYVQAYRYIVDRLRKMDVANVHFVWHTIAWRDQSWAPYDPMKWYPGDTYVDWVGISFFDSHQDTERIAAADLSRKLNKPLMIAESSPFNRYTVDKKRQWIDTLFQYIQENNVRFLSYINVNWDALPLFEKEKWGDARLQNDGVLMNHWLEKIEGYRGL